MKLNKKSVMIFGGSYNPIHQGHLNAALATSKQLGVDEVWLMPRKYNYDGSLLLDGKHRVNMIELAIKHLDNFKVCNVELLDNKKQLIYTYNTAKKLTKLYLIPLFSKYCLASSLVTCECFIIKTRMSLCSL